MNSKNITDLENLKSKYEKIEHLLDESNLDESIKILDNTCEQIYEYYNSVESFFVYE